MPAAEALSDSVDESLRHELAYSPAPKRSANYNNLRHRCPLKAAESTWA